MGQRISDLIDITQEELESIKHKMDNGDTKIIYSDKKLECKLMKIQNKVYEIIYTYGDIPFKDIFGEMIKTRYSEI